MKSALLTSVAAAVVAATVAGAIVWAQAGDGRDPPKVPATDALQPGEATKLPSGQRIDSNLAQPIDIGPFRVLPTGGVPKVCAPADPVGKRKSKLDVVQVTSFEEAGKNALFVGRSNLPSGYELTEAILETVVWDDGSRTDSRVALNFEAPRKFPLRIYRLRFGDCALEVVNTGPDTEQALTVGEVAGVPAIFMHQAPGSRIQPIVNVQFIQDGVLTVVESVAMDLDELTAVAATLIRK